MSEPREPLTGGQLTGGQLTGGQLTNGQLWDIAGVDGLALAERLFDESISYLSPFQSVETVLAGKDCSVLRLCDRNFRILYPDSPLQHITSLGCNIHIRQYSWLTTFSLPISQLRRLTEKATVRAPHRLTHLPNHQAVPAQLDNIPLLIWRHSPRDEPTIDIHTASTSVKALIQKISRL